MAIYPCSRHGGRYSGAQQTIYPAVIQGADGRREKQRLCPDCFSDSLEWLQVHCYRVQDGGVNDDPSKCSCGAAAVATIFATVYASGQDREDYFSPVCEQCLPDAVATLLGPERAKGAPPTS